MNPQDKEYRECRDKYYARPSSFAIPYFRDRSGMPAPMNKDSKAKVELGYLDLYSTRLRTCKLQQPGCLVLVQGGIIHAPVLHLDLFPILWTLSCLYLPHHHLL